MFTIYNKPINKNNNKNNSTAHTLSLDLYGQPYFDIYGSLALVFVHVNQRPVRDKMPILCIFLCYGIVLDGLMGYYGKSSYCQVPGKICGGKNEGDLIIIDS
jgi:hypothetical protein